MSSNVNYRLSPQGFIEETVVERSSGTPFNEEMIINDEFTNSVAAVVGVSVDNWGTANPKLIIAASIGEFLRLYDIVE